MCVIINFILGTFLCRPLQNNNANVQILRCLQNTTANLLNSYFRFISVPNLVCDTFSVFFSDKRIK